MNTDWQQLAALMDRVADGEDAAFGPLSEAVQDSLFRFGLAHGLNRTDAAETVQEVLFRVYCGRASWRNGSSAMAWHERAWAAWIARTNAPRRDSLARDILLA